MKIETSAEELGGILADIDGDNCRGIARLSYNELGQAILDRLARLLPPVTTLAQSLKVATSWRVDGYPYHDFVGTSGENYCRRCTGERDSIQHK